MAVPQGTVLAAVLLFVSWSLPFSSSSPACPQPCTCQRASLLNCSSSGLSSVPQLIQDSFTELDLSHNLLSSVRLQQPHRNLRNVRLGNNSITQLSLCIGRSPEGRYLRGRHRLKPWSRRGCVSWAPTLQLLSVERNQLEQLPDGLEGVESLQVLQLSFNRISTLQPGDLNGLRLLKELDLKHNLISSLHPQMFQDLVQLRVLDLRFNMLTSLHPLMHLTLLNIGSDVRLEGNKWQCDCTMRSIRRRMAYDSSRGLQAWSMVCASPSILSGRDLLQLEDDDLNCVGTENSPELHQDVTVYSGSKILLSCSAQDPMWWTPNGQASVSQTDLLIRDITERDAGLYVCVSEEQQVVSIYNLQISKLRGGGRKPRSLPRTIRQIVPNKAGEERNQRATQSDLTLAVCLSVFITFLIAFILGVLARPCIDVLWKKVTKKKTSPATNSVPSVEQRQYDNEAFSNSEEPEEIGACRERRVTFSTVEYRNDHNVQYYDTVASGNQESTNMADIEDIERQAAEAFKSRNTDGDSGSKNSSKQSSPEDEQDDGRDLSADCRTGHTHNMEFEHIPDPVELEERGSLSSRSDSSLSEKALKEDQLIQRDHTRPKSPQLVKDSVQQTADFSTSNPIPGFSSKPFADWSPHTETRNPTDPDLLEENEELFEFSDSVRSSSARSSTVFGSFNDPKRTVPYISDKQKRDDTSSSSSYMSEDEPTQYTVNSDQDINRDVSFGLQIHSGDLERLSVKSNQGDYRGGTKRPVVRPDHSSSSGSSDSDAETVQCTIKQDTDDEEKEKSIHEYDESSRIVTAEKETREKFTPKPQTKWRGVSLVVATHGKSLNTNATSPPAAYSSSCSSESDAEITNLKVERIRDRKGQIKKQLDINASLPYSDSSSGDERMDDTTKHTNRQENREVVMAGLDPDAGWPAVDLQHIPRIKRRLDIKAPSPASDSSSSSDSEDETTKHTKKNERGGLHTTRFPSKVSQTMSQEPETRSPTLELRQTPHIKRRLDIKASSPPSDSSSSSDSEDDTTKRTNKQEEEELHMSRLPNKISPTVSQEPDRGWPAIDLQHIPRIKRRLDIKAPTPASDSPWNSDDEPKKYMKKNEQEELHMSRPPIKVSPTISHDPEQRWPLPDLEHTTRIKRHLDIKAPTPASDSSSSSDSDDDTTKHIKKQQHEESRLLSKVSRTVSQEQDARWPTLDLQRIPQIKRRLDIKAPSPASGSSSNSDSEGEATDHTVGQRPGKLDTGVLPFQESQRVSQDPDTKWPAVDLQHIPRIKRRLDIKAPSPASGSSCSNDSEDETTKHIKKQELEELHVSRPPIKVSPTISHDPEQRWPLLDLEHTTRIKRHLDIKAPTQASDSSSSSDSDDDTTKHIKKQQHEESRLLSKVSQTVSQEQDAGWPTLDLQRIPQIKRRLDIKAPSPASGSSSNSDSEGEATDHTVGQRPGKLDTGVLPFQESQRVSQDPDTKWPAVDLQHIPRIKRRLDIKAPSPASGSSCSNGSEGEATDHTVGQRPGKLDTGVLPFQESQRVSQDPDTKWPAVDLQHIPWIKRRLDIKAPSPASRTSSYSDSEDEMTNHTKAKGQGMTHMAKPPNTLLDTVKHDQETQWLTRDLQHVPHIKAPSLQPDRSVSSMSLGFRQSESNSSTRESEDEKRDHKTEVEMGLSTTSKASEKEFVRSPTAPVINISHSPKTDHNVKLQKYAVVSDDLGNKPTNDNTYTMPEINSDLQSRWATMSLGISRSRRRLSSGTQEPPNLPSSPPPDSPSSSSGQSGTVRKTNRTIPRRRVVGMQEVISPESSLILENKPVNVGPTLKDQDDKSIHSVEVKERLRDNYSLSTTQEKSINLQLPDFSSSSSEDETDHRVPDLSLGIPSNSPSSESESENEVKEYTVKQSRHAPNKSGMIDIDSVITYNRMIMKASSPPGNSLSLSDKNQTVDYTKQRYTEAEIVTVAQEDEGDGNASLSPRRVPRMSFGDIAKKRMEQSSSNTEADLPPEMRWTGVGHRLADLSISTPRRSLNAALTSLEQTPPAEPKLPSLNSPNSSSSTIDIRVKQDSCKSDVTLMHKYSSLSPNRASPASSGALDNSLSSTDETLRAVSDNRRERKGLSALKAMSSERRRWDTNLDAGASPLFDDRGTQKYTSLSYHKSEADIKPLSKQPLTQLNLSSASVGGGRTMELLYGVPMYKRHDIKEMEPLQEAPPPVPATPPPAEAEELTWRSPQSSKKQEWERNRSYQRTNMSGMESSLMSENLATYFDPSNPNVSDV